MCVLCGSAFSLSEAVWTWVSPFGVFVAVGVVVYTERKVLFTKWRHTCDIYTLSDNRQLRAIMIENEPQFSAPMYLHSASKLLPWGLAISAERASTAWYQTSHKHVRWVLKGECNDVDYRRLCRAIIHAQGTHNTRNNIDVS